VVELENQDFLSLTQTGEREIGATRRIEYFLTLDAAKHFAMLEKTETGFAIRQYFVEFEKQAKKALPRPFPFLFPAPRHQPHVQL